MNLVELTERLHAIRDRNDWRQFHSPKNLAMAASVEMSELVEIFQWLTEDQSRQLPADKLAHAGQEVGDIVLYLLLLCSELGLDMNDSGAQQARGQRTEVQLMSDRHFDQLATRFAEKIYGGAKGAIRLAVLQADLAEILPDRPLRVLDIGAGLGHMSLWLAQRGHQVTLAEPAEPMLEGARQRFADAGQTATFIQAPWQELLGQLTEPYDLVLCHAVLEWLAEPHAILPVLHQLTKAEGWLSLAFYNRDALIYRNLLKGHFRKMRKNDMAGEKQSLTPQQPLDPRELAAQLEGLWRVETQSGVRVFHDYMPVEFQARAELVDLLEMELAHRRHPSFAGLGRYLHWICRPV